MARCHIYTSKYAKEDKIYLFFSSDGYNSNSVYLSLLSKDDDDEATCIAQSQQSREMNKRNFRKYFCDDYFAK